MKIDKSRGTRICRNCGGYIFREEICISEGWSTRSICVKCFLKLFIELKNKINMDSYFSEIFEELL